MSKNTQGLHCQDLLNFIGDKGKFDNLMSLLNPTISDDQIRAWSDPNTKTPTISNDIELLLTKYLLKKLTYYNTKHYRIFEENILLTFSPISIMELQLKEFLVRLNDLYPNVVKDYKLKICIFDGIEFILIDTLLETIRKIDPYNLIIEVAINCSFFFNTQKRSTWCYHIQ